MIKLFRLKKELAKQIAEVRLNELAMQQQVQRAKEHTHDKLTSPVTLSASFASGAAVGWLLTRPKDRNAVSDGAATSSTADQQQSKIISSTLKNVAGLAASMIAAEVSSKTMGVVKDVLLAEESATATEVDEQQPDTTKAERPT